MCFLLQVCASHLWKKVIDDLDNAKGLASHNLRRLYIKYLLPYECALRNENYDEVLALAQRKWHSNSTNEDTTERGKEDLNDISGLAKTTVSENDDSVPTSVPQSNSSAPQSGTTSVPHNLKQQNLNFSPMNKPTEANDLPHLPNETSSVNSPFPAHLKQQQRDPLDSLNPSPLNKSNLFNCSSPMSMPPHRSGTPSSQSMNTGGMNNDWNRRPPGEMWNHPYPPDPAYRNITGQPPSKGYYGDPYQPSPPRHPMYRGMPGMGSNHHPVEFAEYQRHGIRPPVPYQPNQQQHHMQQQMTSDPYRPYRFSRQGMMEFQSHGSGPGMMAPGSPMMPEWAWKQQQQQQQQQHHSRPPYGSHYGSHVSSQQHHQRAPNPMMVQQQHQQQHQQQAYAARLEQQQHQQQQWQDHNIKLSKAPYPTTAVQPSPIKSQLVAGAPQQQHHHHHHHPTPSTESKSSSVAAALEKKVPPEWVNTVEGTKPLFAKKRKLMSNDCG